MLKSTVRPRKITNVSLQPPHLYTGASIPTQTHTHTRESFITALFTISKQQNQHQQREHFSTFIEHVDEARTVSSPEMDIFQAACCELRFLFGFGFFSFNFRQSAHALFFPPVHCGAERLGTRGTEDLEKGCGGIGSRQRERGSMATSSLRQQPVGIFRCECLPSPAKPIVSHLLGCCRATGTTGRLFSNPLLKQYLVIPPKS